MAFINKIIGPDETLIGISGAHWIYGATGLAWLVGLMVVGLVLDYYATGLFDYLFMSSGAFAADRIGDALFWMPTALGVVMFFLYFLMMISPEIGLTSKRVVLKRGIIFVSVKEVDLEELKAANVNNGLLGRFFNYGFVVFDARFVEGMDLPAIGNPYRFVKALNDAKSKLKSDSMTVVLEGGGQAAPVAAQAQAEVQSDAPEQPKKQRKKMMRPRMPQKNKAPAHAGEYEDKADESPHQAASSVFHEVVENTKHAIKGSPLSRFSRKPKASPQPAEPVKPGPVVFDNDLLNKERELRQEIKDDFKDTAA